jgi:hypothetical protein
MVSCFLVPTWETSCRFPLVHALTTAMEAGFRLERHKDAPHLYRS